MKLLTFAADADAATRLGALVAAGVLDLRRAFREAFGAEPPQWFGSVGDLLAGGDPAMSLARALAERFAAAREPSLVHDAEAIVFHPPTGRSAKVLCVTMNYLSHAQATLTKPSEDPYFFVKMGALLTPHRAPVLCSRTSQKCDSEIELAVVIGKRGKYIQREEAMTYVAGYTIANDFSFRDRRTLKSDPNSARLNWLTLKNLDTAAPIGPWLVTSDELTDPYSLEITLTLDNDPQQRQTGHTAGMMHRIEDLIYHASDGLTLDPGDVILTGTPHEVAFGRQRFLMKGDILRAEISGIGALVNPVQVED